MNTVVTRCIAALFVFSVAALAAVPVFAQEAGKKSRPIVAVLRFSMPGQQNKELDDFMVNETIKTLHASGACEVKDSKQIENAVGEIKWSDSGYVSDETRKKIGALKAADYFVYGRVTSLETHNRVVLGLKVYNSDASADFTVTKVETGTIDYNQGKSASSIGQLSAESAKTGALKDAIKKFVSERFPGSGGSTVSPRPPCKGQVIGMAADENQVRIDIGLIAGVKKECCFAFLYEVEEERLDGKKEKRLKSIPGLCARPLQGDADIEGDRSTLEFGEYKTSGGIAGFGASTKWREDKQGLAKLKKLYDELKQKNPNIIILVISTPDRRNEAPKPPINLENLVSGAGSALGIK